MSLGSPAGAFRPLFYTESGHSQKRDGGQAGPGQARRPFSCEVTDLPDWEADYEMASFVLRIFR